MKPKILFILKYRESSDSGTYNRGKGTGLPSGLLNSAKFIVDMLAHEHVDVKLVQVTDNNDIDREVSLYQPTHAIIEALWVVPEKFDILQRLHPSVAWIVRVHSDIPFLSQEGVAMDWLCRYVAHENVIVASNAEDTVESLRSIIRSIHPEWPEALVKRKLAYLPNFYPTKASTAHPPPKDGRFVNVACFGAIRPMKNQLIQAVAAIKYAESQGKILRFHINATRSETGGDNPLKNLRDLFRHVPHELVEHTWMSHSYFLGLLRTMDIGLQVSFSETFNIVAADYAVAGLPAVVSPEISWASPWCQADPTDAEDIFQKMARVADWPFRWLFKRLNLFGLREFARDSKHRWLRYFRA